MNSLHAEKKQAVRENFETAVIKERAKGSLNILLWLLNNWLGGKSLFFNLSKLRWIVTNKQYLEWVIELRTR